MSARKILLTLHLVGGLLSAVTLIILGVTGGLLVWEGEIAHLLDPQLYKVTPTGSRMPLNALVAAVEQQHPGAKVTNISPAKDEAIAYTMGLRAAPPAKGLSVSVNPYTGAELGSMETASQLPKTIHQFHTNLLLGPLGKLITMTSALFLLGLAVSGVILWWPRKILKVNVSGGGRAANFDLHNALGFYASVFMLLFAITGIVIHWDNELAAWLNQREGFVETPPPKTVPPSTDGRRLDVEALAGIAQASAPGARVTGVLGLNGNAPVRITMKFPEDGTPAGRTNLFLNPFTGEVLYRQTSREAPIGIRLIKLWNREIHTGDIGGLTTRVLASLASFSLPLLAVTGPLIWWGRWRRKRRA